MKTSLRASGLTKIDLHAYFTYYQVTEISAPEMHFNSNLPINSAH